MALPIMPILLAIPAAAGIIHDLFGGRDTTDKQKFQQLLELAETRLRESQEEMADVQKKYLVAETRLDEVRAKLVDAEEKRTVAETQLHKSEEQRILGNL